MLAMVIMILFIVLLLVSVPISATLSAVSLAPSLLDPNFHISSAPCWEELIPSRCSLSRCLCCPVF